MIIYKCTNKVNGKYYIGKTQRKLETRIAQHKSEAKSYRDKTLCAFHNALNKYGFENFEWEVIDTADTLEELNQKEIFWIDKLKSLTKFGLGYNINTGGEGKDNFTEHPDRELIRKKVGEGVRKSNRWTAERKAEASKNFKENNPMKLHPEKSFFRTNNPMKLEKYKRRGEDNPMSNLEVRRKHKERVNDPEIRKRIAEKVSAKTKGKSKPREQVLKCARIKSSLYWAKYDEFSKQLLEVYESFCEIKELWGLGRSYSYSKRIYGPYKGFIWVNYRKNEIDKENIPATFRESL